jgi:hypothetical protein
VQENLAQKCGGTNTGLTHAQRIGLVDFWLEQLSDEGKEDFTEDSSPFLVFGGGEVVG